MEQKRGYVQLGEPLPKETYMKQVESIPIGQTIVYQTSKMFWDTLGAFLFVEMNPNYPGKHQKKYNIYGDMITDGKPAGQKRTIVQLDKPQHVVDFLKDKAAKPFIQS